MNFALILPLECEKAPSFREKCQTDVMSTIFDKLRIHAIYDVVVQPKKLGLSHVQTVLEHVELPDRRVSQQSSEDLPVLS
ncbi:MAG: hypothetical protein R6U96_17920 [Promethearchaeia archaeon]